MVYEDTFPDVSYFQNKYEDNQQMIKNYLWKFHLSDSEVTEFPFNKSLQGLIMSKEEK